MSIENIINFWQYIGYRTINKYILGFPKIKDKKRIIDSYFKQFKKLKIDEILDYVILTLQEHILKQEIDQSMILYRGMDVNISECEIGDTIDLSTFASFTSCFSVSNKFKTDRDAVIFECLFPKGSHLLHIKGEEFEFLTPRCNQYKIIDIEKIKNKKEDFTLVKLILIGSNITDYISDPITKKWISEINITKQLYTGLKINRLSFENIEQDLDIITDYLSNSIYIYPKIKTLNYFKKDDFYYNCDYENHLNVILLGDGDKIIFNSAKIDHDRFGNKMYILS